MAAARPGPYARIVAELRRSGDDADLAYLVESPDFLDAKTKGFEGFYPGFPGEKVHKNVLSAFIRRLPPRQRNDFDRFLEAIRIRPGTQVSDFALLGYAGARLPSDDFAIIHPFDDANPPFEFLLMLAGYQYYDRIRFPLASSRVGMRAAFEMEPENPNDPEAVRVVIPDVRPGGTAGYVCRGLLPQFRRWLGEGLRIEASVERVNGRRESRKSFSTFPSGIAELRPSKLFRRVTCFLRWEFRADSDKSSRWRGPFARGSDEMSKRIVVCTGILVAGLLLGGCGEPVGPDGRTEGVSAEAGRLPCRPG